MKLLDFFKKKDTIQEIKGNNITNSNITISSGHGHKMYSDGECTFIQLNGNIYKVPCQGRGSVVINNGDVYLKNKKLSSKELKKYLVD